MPQGAPQGFGAPGQNPYNVNSSYGNFGNQPPQAPSGSSHVSPADLDNNTFEIINNIDKLGNDFIEGTQGTINKLLCAKVELKQTQGNLEDKIESFKERIAQADSVIQQLEQRNGQIQTFLGQNSGSGQAQLSEANLDQLVYPKDPYSNKIIDFTAKENAYEDCMAALKKAYEKDLLTLPEFLAQIRKLSVKQFKSTYKRNKVITALQSGASQQR
ncbi:hypothetical protein FGO68_gene11295 [Halteria grandinella]|uniref:SB domain-containing protein n=1 Tax=Halteria grandinella TaxID=5974 RepID=A0A8J8NCU0_HALGN|nr:hypothetical protein FGO68_gene11295 [Halteria grandinella]